MRTKTMIDKMIPIVLVFATLFSKSFGFNRPYSPIYRTDRKFHHVSGNSPLALFAEGGNKKDMAIQEDALLVETEEGANGVKMLGPASSLASDKSEDSDESVNLDLLESKQVFMITREMRRQMIEELGYRRTDIDCIRVDLVADIIENRIRCPSDGMPNEWIDKERESMNNFIEQNSLAERLESESKYPLKFPLLAVSLILFGKGFSDALITIIKVNIDFPGVSLTDQFQGIPILAIDFVCAVAGASLGFWTWNTMK